MNVNSVFFGHSVDGRSALLLATLLCGSHCAGVGLERECRDCHILCFCEGETWFGSCLLYLIALLNFLYI